MPSKVKTAKIILQVIGWFFMVGAIVSFIIFLVGTFIIGISVEKNAAIARVIMGGVGLIIILILVLFGIIYLITAKGISNKKGWAKIVGIILGVLVLPSIPIGTVLGIFILIGLLSDEANTWFES